MGLNATLGANGWTVELDTYGSNLTADQIAQGSVGVAGVTADGGVIGPDAVALNAVPVGYSLGTLWANWDTAPVAAVNSTRISDGSDASPDPDAPLNVVKIPYASGATSTYDHAPASAYSLTNVDTLGIWLRATPRVDGDKYTIVKILLSDSAVGFTNFGNANICVRADGRWHFCTLNTALFTTGGGAWSTASAVARIRLREGDGGSTTNRAQMTSATESIFVGAIRANPKQRAMALIRFDDGLSSLYSSGNITVSSLFTGTSGVSVPAGTYSMKQIVDLFGFVANAYIVTDSIGQSGFETVAGLTALQNAGWDICYQGAANPISQLGGGIRLLGPLGYSLIATGGISNVNTTTGVFTTTAAESNVVSAVTGQPFPVTLTGTDLPAGLQTGQTYYLYRASANTFTIHTAAAGSWDGTSGKVIPSTTGTLANFGFRYAGSANDHSAILADMQRGTTWLTSNGFKRGARHYALNQGAWDIHVERAFFAFGGFDTVMPIRLNNAPIASGISASTPVFDAAHYHAVPADTVSQIYATLHASWMNICDVLNTDSGGSGRGSATVRQWVQQSVKRGQVFSNYHHGAVLTTDLDLLYYLDEIKLWSDRGLLDVVTVSEAWARIKATRDRLTWTS